MLGMRSGLQRVLQALGRAKSELRQFWAVPESEDGQELALYDRQELFQWFLLVVSERCERDETLL